MMFSIKQTSRNTWVSRRRGFRIKFSLWRATFLLWWRRTDSITTGTNPNSKSTGTNSDSPFSFYSCLVVHRLPVLVPTVCGCTECTDEVLVSTMAGGAHHHTHTCGAKIDWLEAGGGGSKSEKEACRQISRRDKFDEVYGPMCDPNRCIMVVEEGIICLYSTFHHGLLA